MMLLGLLLHAAVPTSGMICGPAVPERGLGAAHRHVAGAPILDKRGAPPSSLTTSPDACKTDGMKGKLKGAGIPLLKAPYVS